MAHVHLITVTETMYTLNCTENHAVAYDIGRPAMNQGYNAKFSFQIEEEKSPTIMASGAGGITHPIYQFSSYRCKKGTGKAACGIGLQRLACYQ